MKAGIKCLISMLNVLHRQDLKLRALNWVGTTDIVRVVQGNNAIKAVFRNHLKSNLHRM